MHMYPQAYADLAAIDWLQTEGGIPLVLRALARAAFGRRLIFASDQMICYVAALLSTNLPNRETSMPCESTYSFAVRLSNPRANLETHMLPQNS
jgi:hypothetical protein